MTGGGGAARGGGGAVRGGGGAGGGGAGDTAPIIASDRTRLDPRSLKNFWPGSFSSPLSDHSSASTLASEALSSTHSSSSSSGKGKVFTVNPAAESNQGPASLSSTSEPSSPPSSSQVGHTPEKSKGSQSGSQLAFSGRPNRSPATAWEDTSSSSESCSCFIPIISYLSLLPLGVCRHITLFEVS